MNSKTILVIGGYGSTGKILVRLLLDQTDAQVVVAGRNGGKAKKFAESLQSTRVTSTVADASDIASLEKAFAEADLALSAGTVTGYIDLMTKAAISTGTDFMDIHFQGAVYTTLKELESDIRAAGRCFITQAGCHPGLSYLMIKKSAPSFDLYKKAVVGMAMSLKADDIGSVTSFIEDLQDYQSLSFRNGKWGKNYDSETFDFGPPFGVKKGYPIFLEEIREAPEIFGLESTGIYAASVNWVVDFVVLPLALLLGAVRKGAGIKTLARIAVWWDTRFPPKFTAVTLLLNAEGEKEGKPVRASLKIEHEDAYYLTAAPVVACLKQYLEKSPGPGLHMMGHICDPGLLFADLEDMGIRIKAGPSSAGSM